MTVSCEQLSNSSRECSFPSPEFFHPPNGTAGPQVSTSFSHTYSARTRWEARIAVETSRPQGRALTSS
jgi:hypothetical protein